MYNLRNVPYTVIKCVNHSENFSLSMHITLSHDAEDAMVFDESGFLRGAEADEIGLVCVAVFRPVVKERLWLQFLVMLFPDLRKCLQ